MYLRPQNRVKTKNRKKVLRRKIQSFCPRNQVKNKKKVFTAILNYILPEFVGFVCADRPFFV